MFRCPIADYMAAHGLADLCVGTWCNADFALAEVWGARLDRKGTLAGGASYCDFRFVVGDMAGRSATHRRTERPDQAEAAADGVGTRCQLHLGGTVRQSMPRRVEVMPTARSTFGRRQPRSARSAFRMTARSMTSWNSAPATGGR